MWEGCFQMAEINMQIHNDEHILCCLPSFSSNEKVIRIAAETAEAYNGALTALFLFSSTSKKMSAGELATLHKNQELAKQTGAQMITVYGNNVVHLVSEYAKANHITKVVIGYSVNKYFLGFCRKNNIDKITYLLLPDIEVYVVS